MPLSRWSHLRAVVPTSSIGWDQLLLRLFNALCELVPTCPCPNPSLTFSIERVY